MMPMEREPEPEILLKNGVGWTKAWLKRLQSHVMNPNFTKPGFKWPIKNKMPLNQHIMKALLRMTANHCSYCDGFPMGVMTTNTIDHFKPKETYPDQAFVWENLFACCNACQRAKMAQYHEELLKPDHASYQFSTYFLFNYRTGEIEVNPFASKPEQKRARKTLDILNLNNAETGLPGERVRVYQRHQHQDGSNNWAYRFMFQ